MLTIVQIHNTGNCSLVQIPKIMLDGARAYLPGNKLAATDIPTRYKEILLTVVGQAAH